MYLTGIDQSVGKEVQNRGIELRQIHSCHVVSIAQVKIIKAAITEFLVVHSNKFCFHKLSTLGKTLLIGEAAAFGFYNHGPMNLLPSSLQQQEVRRVFTDSRPGAFCFLETLDLEVGQISFTVIVKL